MLAELLAGWRLSQVLTESLLIGGWVAMWRPLEIFLYDWWPIRAEARLLDRLSAMPVRVAHRATGTAAPPRPQREGAAGRAPTSRADSDRSPLTPGLE